MSTIACLRTDLNTSCGNCDDQQHELANSFIFAAATSPIEEIIEGDREAGKVIVRRVARLGC
jgi:hypothetical protein